MSPQEYGQRAARTRLVSPRTYAALLQQRPTPDAETLLVSRDVAGAVRRARSTPPGPGPPAAPSSRSTRPAAARTRPGVVAGYLGPDRGRTPRTTVRRRMSAAQWGRAACLLAHDVGADAFVVEKNYGGDLFAARSAASLAAARRAAPRRRSARRCTP